MKVMTFGTFDLFHPGHKYYLSEARKLGDELIVIIARDARVLKRKGRAPIHSEYERLTRVAENFSDIMIVLGDEEDILTPLRTYSPDILAFGYDQYVPEKEIQKEFPEMKWVRIAGYETDTYKSSKLREKLP